MAKTGTECGLDVNTVGEEAMEEEKDRLLAACDVSELESLEYTSKAAETEVTWRSHESHMILSELGKCYTIGHAMSLFH